MNTTPQAVQNLSFKQKLKCWVGKHPILCSFLLTVMLWRAYWWHFNTPIRTPWPEKSYSIKGRLRSKVYFIRLCFLPFVCACSMSGEIKKEILEASWKSEKEIVYLDLSKITGKKVEKICIQNQYMTEGVFSQSANIEIVNFHDVEEGGFVLWIVFEKDDYLQIKLKKSELYFSNDEKFLSRKNEPCWDSGVIKINRRSMSFV